ncbi:MAG TPA: ROK family protein [Flavitalea sp.]|nr:ROK family protein [Flavitalea sp.]
MQTNKPFMGIEIGGTKLQLVTGTAAGEILTKHRFQIEKKQGAKGIRDLIERTIKENYTGKIDAVGIGFGGPVNWRTGLISTSFHIEGWANFNLTEWLQSLVGAPVFLENDANVAALGEAMHGAGKGYELVLYITIGSGIGGGLVIKNEIYHGAIPGEVEMGHLRMNRSGDTFQSLCSGWGIDERIRNVIAKNPSGKLAKIAGDRDSGEAAFLKSAIEQNDSVALHLFEEVIDDMAFGLSHAIHLFHPEIVILGGGFSLIGDMLKNNIEKRIPAYLMEAFHPGPVFRLAELRELSVPTGALFLAAKNYHSAKK